MKVAVIGSRDIKDINLGEYLKDDVERLLKHFKKHQKIHEDLERIKPVQMM